MKLVDRGAMRVMAVRRSALLLAGWLVCAGLVTGHGTARADVSREILNITDALIHSPAAAMISVAQIQEPRVVDLVYQQTAHQPLWDRALAAQMLNHLRRSTEEGLNPSDYHYNELLALQAEYGEPWANPDLLRAQFDILLTDGVLHFARHLLEGKVDPRTLDSTWNYDRRIYEPRRVSADLIAAVRAGSLSELVEGLKPDTPFYHQMRDALGYYGELADTEQFFLVPDSVVLKPGLSHPNVRLLRARLKQLSYLLPNSPETEYFDEQLEAATRLFQKDNGIDNDGIVGRQSYQVLNMTFQARVDRLRVNMDRYRWIRQEEGREMIVVNIAGYELYYLRDGELQWETPVMVGTIDTRTPIFQAQLRYLEFNPTWNVPRSIIHRSLFGKFAANPRYVVDKGYRLYDSNGAVVDPLTVNWSNYSSSTFPFRVVQMPGPDNAMGQVKFMFPNRHAVYLHDTPSKSLFSKTQRAFSAGCIRVQNPLDFARVLLNDPAKWSDQQIQGLVDSGDPQHVVRIQRQINVMLMYWTVSPTTSSRIQFHPDVYQLDAAALAALNAD
ncbi:MAG: L,D-transpeptidase family protein [Halioglobus sp.]